MSNSRKVGFYRIPLLGNIALFFLFLGHLCYGIKDFLRGRLSISWMHFLLIVYHSGAKMVIPMMIVSSLMGASLILNIYRVLTPVFLQDQILLVAQNILFYDLIPFILGLVLSIQLALNLVNAQIKRLQRSPQEVVLQIIIPLIIGGNLSALLLYIYSLNALFFSIYLCFRYLLNTNLHEYLFHLTNTISTVNISYSIFKSLIYCTIVCLVVGYYYYSVASSHLSLRKAMSRIMSRSLACITISSIYFKFFSY